MSGPGENYYSSYLAFLWLHLCQNRYALRSASIADISRPLSQPQVAAGLAAAWSASVCPFHRAFWVSHWTFGSFYGAHLASSLHQCSGWCLLCLLILDRIFCHEYAQSSVCHCRLLNRLLVHPNLKLRMDDWRCCFVNPGWRHGTLGQPQVHRQMRDDLLECLLCSLKQICCGDQC